MEFLCSQPLHHSWHQRVERECRGLGMNGKIPIERLQELASVNLTVQGYKSGQIDKSVLEFYVADSICNLATEHVVFL